MSFSSDLKKTEQLWAAIMKMATEMKKAGVKVDLAKLKTSKMMISHCRTDPHHHVDELNNAVKILGDVQVELFIAAESLEGDFVSRWEDEFMKVRGGKSRYEFSVSSSRFVPGLPRGMNWVRINISGIVDADEMKKLVKSCGAVMENQEDGYVLVTGEKDSIKRVLKSVSEVFKR